ncbi:MAG: hypothetical protein ACREO7_06150 [Pseudoxanthomonas sp.]
MRRNIFSVLVLLLPIMAHAQAQGGAAEAGYKTGYLIGFLCPIVAIVGIVVWVITLIFRKPKPPRNKHRSGW